MALEERRQSPRITPKGLKASIYLEPWHEPAFMEGDVLDISHTGIKIRLKTPTAAGMDGKIKIQLFLPETRIPLSITGILKHQANPTDVGLHYINSPNVLEMDKFIFQCIKLVKN